jgi:predicted DNA-binding protein (MmcQ/YjbR family)
MDPDALRDYALAKPGAWADQPWEGDHDAAVGVKAAATREAADEWLARYPGDARVMPYIGRSGWNTLTVGGAIPDDEILAAVDDSYALVVSKLPKKHRPDGWDAV